MSQAAELLSWLEGAPILKKMEPAAFNDYGARLGGLLADPADGGDIVDLWKLTLRVYELGDETSSLTLALHLREHADDHHRFRATARAGRCLYELGLHQESQELLRTGLQELKDQDTPLRPILENMLGLAYDQSGAGVEAEHHYHRALRLIRKYDDATLKRMQFAATKAMMLHPPLLNLAKLTVVRAMRMEGEVRRWLLADAHRRIEEGLSGGDCPVSFIAMYETIRGMALTAGEQYEEALAHFDAQEAVIRATPEQRWVLPTMLRERARLRARRGEAQAAYADLRLTLAESVDCVSVIEEREVAEEIFNVLAELYGIPPESETGGEDTADISGEQRVINAFFHEGEGLLSELLHCLESKDWYTGHGHSRSVATLAERLRKALPPDLAAQVDAPRLHTGGLLHDIGKLVIPWALLNKIAPLSMWERRYLQTHAAQGGRLLKKVGLNTAATVAGGHHRFYSGGGYPDPVPQADIYTSLVSVADAFEAMITPTRKYRKSKTVPEAIAEIRRCSPSQFSPEVTTALEGLYGIP
jgi:HD-GYP domain-containing protein (c-di-GMP phosphodiesterase class II)